MRLESPRVDETCLKNRRWPVALGSAGQLSLAQSLRIGDASAVLPVDFLRLVWSTALGFILFSEVPDIWTLVGGVVVFSATTYLALREFHHRPHS